MKAASSKFIVSCRPLRRGERTNARRTRAACASTTGNARRRTAEVAKVWDVITTETIPELSDFAGVPEGILSTLRFGLEGVDYSAEADPIRPVPSLA